MMEPTKIDDGGGGLDRRSVLRRGAVLGGALVWTVPAVQTIAGPAFATGSPRCSASLKGEITYADGSRGCLIVSYAPVETCCSCVAGKVSAGKDLPVAIALCADNGACAEQSRSAC